MRKLILILILLFPTVIHATDTNPWHEETKKEGRFCSAIEVMAREEKMIVDCNFYNNSFHFTTANTFSFKHWARYPYWVFVAFSQRLLESPLPIDKYTAVIVVHDNNPKAAMYMNYRDIYMCSVYFKSTMNEENYQKCITQFSKLYTGQYD